MRQNLNLVTDPRFAWRTRRFSGYDIPPQEVAELYKLYTQTGGPNWINHTNWFENKTCATWFGLTVEGGLVTGIDLQSNNLAGATNFNPKPFLGLTTLNARKVTSNNTLRMQFQLMDLPSAMQNLTLSDTESGITGSLSELPPDIRYLYLRNTHSLIYGGATPMTALAVRDIGAYTDVHTTASKDSIIERLYADRALFTYAGHAINISGGPALTGAYQTSAAPSTPAEKAYALVNDPNGELFLKWVITL